MSAVDRPRALRLFIGVRVSLATVRALDEAVQAMRSARRAKVNWVAPACYHITLKFLGWTRPEVAFALRDRVGEAVAGRRAFDLETLGLGAFPSPDRARIVWAGVDPAGSARLKELAALLERATEQLGFAPEQRPFHPHVTLGRLRERSDVREMLARCPEQFFRGSSIDTVVLFESHMKSSGSEYEEKARWPLEGDSKAPRRHTGPVETEAELADDIPLGDAPDDEPAGEPAGGPAYGPASQPADEPANDGDEEQHDDGDHYEGPRS
jgi:RNA 2',3'-cyclic 3'-phosphodiesterase